jgi:hypothetical protein
MTEPTTPHVPTPAAMPAHVPERVSDDSLELPQNLEAAKKLRNENKNLRERLRALEGDYEAAVTRLEAVRHNEIQRVAADHLVDPADIWSAPADLDALTDEYGVVDVAKVTAAAEALLADKPHLGTNYRPVVKPPTDRPIESLRPGASAPEQKSETTWAGALGARIRPSG